MKRALLIAALVAPSVSVAAPIDDLLAELTKPGCPTLFDKLSPEFQKAAPRETWPPFCAPFSRSGKILGKQAAPSEQGMAVFRVSTDKGDLKIGVAVTGGRFSGLFVRPWPAEHAAEAKTRFRLPLDHAFVLWGGRDERSNHHVHVPRQQRAADLVRSESHTGDGQRNEDYPIYGSKVYAAADGVVRVVVDGVPDNVPGTMDDTFVPGNTVAIEHAPGEYAHYCHLKPGTAKVKPGERVTAGQVIGLVGNSGNSSEPHLHFHVQTELELSKGVGLEPIFDGVCVHRSPDVFSAESDAQLGRDYHLYKGHHIYHCASGFKGGSSSK